MLGTGTASAAVDSSNSIVDADGNTVTVTLSDTFINGVAPLDGNPLTREWFANGRASYDVQGPSADDFEGTLKIGYQIGYPMSLNGGVEVSWSSPSAEFNLGSGNESSVTVTVLPSASTIELELSTAAEAVPVPSTRPTTEAPAATATLMDLSPRLRRDFWISVIYSSSCSVPARCRTGKLVAFTLELDRTQRCVRARAGWSREGHILDPAVPWLRARYRSVPRPRCRKLRGTLEEMPDRDNPYGCERNVAVA
ncbi:MspA family porin [Rhodococcus sp. 05-2254-6]|uniref:MspA family porin n=1 Tax=Rhodococcus sp. 05-2254-6 TaxID=2022489 RepID=UPI0027B9FA7C|nr:MspA family porin [Rhodococcus sp. 05-2254-6]